jgi:hypothetical protein
VCRIENTYKLCHKGLLPVRLTPGFSALPDDPATAFRRDQHSRTGIIISQLIVSLPTFYSYHNNQSTDYFPRYPPTQRHQVQITPLTCLAKTNEAGRLLYWALPACSQEM